MFSLHFSIAADLVTRSPSNDAVDRILAAFESVGFVIEGASLSNATDPKIIIRKWGVPHDDASTAWMTLRNSYKLRGNHELAKQALEFSRITWMMIFGEDTTFEVVEPEII